MGMDVANWGGGLRGWGSALKIQGMFPHFFRRKTASSAKMTDFHDVGMTDDVGMHHYRWVLGVIAQQALLSGRPGPQTPTQPFGLYF